MFGEIARLRPRIFQLTSGGAGYGQHALLAATLMPGVRTVLVEHLAVDTDNDLQRRIKRVNIRHLSAHLAPGERSARLVETINGLPAGAVRSVINGVPDEPPVPIPRVSDGPVIGGIGRLHSQKGFDLLVRALAGLPDAQLVLVGDGPERDSLISLAKELGVDERLHLAGWSERPRDYLTSFDVFALPSRNEAYPLVLIEAMLGGVPIVAARVGSVAELVPDGEAGLLIEPEDLQALTSSLRTLIDDPEMRRRMGERGRAVGLTISPERMARAYEQIYRSLM
jgi:glycosyltransferase involved in cell wall biosynthesis